MNRPSTVAEGGHTVIMPLTRIHATPARGRTPSSRESTRIIERKLPPVFVVFVRIIFAGILFAVTFTPELVPGAADEHILERRLAHRDCLNLAGESLDQVRNKAMTVVALNAHLVAQHPGLHVKPRSDMFGEQRRIQQNHVTADLAL